MNIVAFNNTIAFNGRDGVAVFGQGNSGNVIMNNSIHSNGELGIDLRLDNNDNGPTANDAGDEDFIPHNDTAAKPRP